MRCVTPALVVAFVLASPGCSDGARVVAVGFHIVTAPGDDAFLGSRELAFTVEQDGVVGPVAEQRYPIFDRSGSLPSVPFGRSFSVLVEGVAGDVVLARGRSFPFDVLDGEPAPHPDVFVGRLGRFVSPVRRSDDPEPGAAVAQVVSTDSGASIAYADGAIWRYVAHVPESDGQAGLDRIEQRESLAGATWITLDHGRMLAVGGPDGGAALLDSGGAVLATLSPGSLAGQCVGVAVAVVPGTGVVVIGGAAAHDEPPTDSVTLVEVREDPAGSFTLGTLDLAPAPEPRSDAVAVAGEVHDGEAATPFVVLVGGQHDSGPATTALVIDPGGTLEPGEVDLGRSLLGASVVTLGSGHLVLVAGGQGAEGTPVADVRLLVVQARDGRLVIDLVSPAPQPLFTPRAFAAAQLLGEGLVLLVGGRGTRDEPLSSAEIVDTRDEQFPGQVVATGELPAPFGAPRSSVLGDGSILVADEAGIAVYVPPQ
jgi:hypothetical protein